MIACMTTSDLARCNPLMFEACPNLTPFLNLLQIITPVVERSVTIACMTTRELVVKDFAMEADEAAMRQVCYMYKTFACIYTVQPP